MDTEVHPCTLAGLKHVEVDFLLYPKRDALAAVTLTRCTKTFESTQR